MRRTQPVPAVTPAIDPPLEAELSLLHEEIMWLAARPRVTPSMARAWYTHVVAPRLSRRIRHFSGKVSRAAVADPEAVLGLEHHARLQSTLTSLVAAQRESGQANKAAFVRTLLECENVHIVTFSENYQAMKADGNYRQAGIKLMAWRSIPEEPRATLWARMLKGKVANAEQFRPGRKHPAP